MYDIIIITVQYNSVAAVNAATASGDVSSSYYCLSPFLPLELNHWGVVIVILLRNNTHTSLLHWRLRESIV